MSVLHSQKEVSHNTCAGVCFRHLERGSISQAQVRLLHPIYRCILLAERFCRECNQPYIPDDAFGFGRPELYALITIPCVGTSGSNKSCR